MDLLKTILLYLTMVFVSSVQSAPDPSLVQETPSPSLAPSAVVAVVTATAVPTPTPTPVPTPNITPNNDYKTVKVGDKGDDVKLLQRRLAELGYFTGDVDGVFGNQTRRSVERFQYYQGLSVDGIAGKRTLTVLYESKEVVYAPVDVTPMPTAKPTGGPTTAITAPPTGATLAPTFVPAPTATVSASATIAAATAATDLAAANSVAPQISTSPEPEATPAVTETPPVPQLVETQDFVLAGTADALTVPALVATESPVPLHPLQYGDQVYVPFLEILRASGSVLIPGANTDGTQEVAFSVLSDVYQISYMVDNEGNVTNLVVLKNQTPQILSTRNALLVDGTLYLPLTVTTELTGVTYTLDDAATRYTVTVPAPPAN